MRPDDGTEWTSHREQDRAFEPGPFDPAAFDGPPVQDHKPAAGMPDHLSIPDEVPAELVEQYGPKARKAVKHSRSWRYPVSRKLHSASAPLHDSGVWTTAVIIFGWGVAAMAGIGALVYASFLFPSAVVILLIPVVGMFLISVVAAVLLSKRRVRRGRRVPM